jgi:putative addiction module killer protein
VKKFVFTKCPIYCTLKAKDDNSMYKLYKTNEFEDWLNGEPLKSKLQIEDRLLRISCDGHFGDHKRVGDHVWELKWSNGRRIYFAYIAKFNILLLLGGNKNGQSKDIAQAKKILGKYAEASP